ncbi:MAG: hypothetical protein U0L98_03585 [Clostridia bacterium]|nr:hypothetical protein [Clostridia bacterium]
MKKEQQAFWIIMAVFLVIIISSIIISLIGSSIKGINYDDIFRFRR